MNRGLEVSVARLNSVDSRQDRHSCGPVPVNLMKNTILYLIKFFKREEYADQFINGLLYLNTLSYFQKLEHAERS
jgi:hypothetical protein